MKHSDSKNQVKSAESPQYPAVNCKSVEVTELVPPIRLIPVERVGEILGFKTSTVLELAARGELPQKIKFGSSRRASARWVEHEIYAYAWALAANRDLIQVADTPSDAHPESDSSPGGQPQVATAAKKPSSGRPAQKSGGRAK